MRLLRLNNANRTSPVESVPPGIPANKSSRCLTAELGGPGARTSGRGSSHRSGLALGPNLWQRLGSSPRWIHARVRRNAQSPGQLHVGRPVLLLPERPHGGDQRLDRVRPAPGGTGYRRLARPQRHAGRTGHHHPGGPGCDPCGACARCCGEIEEGRFTFSTALEDIHMNVESRLQGDHRRARRSPAHGPEPQRPGGSRRPAVDPRRPRPHGCAADEPARRAAGQGGSPRRHHHAGLHPSAERAARDVRPSPAWPMWRCSAATAAASGDSRRRLNESPLGAAALAGHVIPDRSRR